MDDWESRMADKARLRALESQLRDRVDAERRVEVENSNLMARVRAASTFVEGPEDGCEDCFTFKRHYKFGTWDWEHRWDADAVTRTDDYSAHCSHDCHGPEGYELVSVALAAC